MAKSISLYTYALSPYGMKVYWALVFKGVDSHLRYVSPIDQCEISFTQQKVVPVVEIDSEWRLDSGPICCWLDERFPERPIAGSDKKEREAIVTADKWVSANVIGLSFRSIIDNEAPFSAFRNGRILANTLRKTSGGVSRLAQLIWVQHLRRTEFVVKDASQVDRTIGLSEYRAAIVEQLYERLEKTGYVAGTDTPSYADISVFAQLVCNTTYGFEGAWSLTVRGE